MNSLRRASIALLGSCFAALSSCRSTTATSPGPGSVESAPAASPDPRQEEVSLPAQGGWRATLVLDNGKTGVWTVNVLKIFAHYACPEIVGIDDLGRCHVLWSYSGKWTPVTTIADGKWLGGIAWADVDQRISGRELYTGSQQGNLYQVVAYRNVLLDNRLIATIPGREVHTVVAADVDEGHAGLELVVFTSPAGLYVAAPPKSGVDGFDLRLVQELPGRIRDALVLDDGSRGEARIVTIGRHGKLELLRWPRGGDPSWQTIFEAPMGLGRIARKPASAGEDLVLYSTADDGLIRRHALQRGGTWKTETIYVGAQGPRGICAGRFDPDPDAETVAVFGYSRVVELLTRGAEGWRAETLFTDRDKGHWITSGELDGRNGTDEIVSAGYSGRIVLLARPEGVGLGAAGAAVRVRSPSESRSATPQRP